MSEYISSILPDFKCLAADCPSTCCRGWTVNVDQKTRKNIRSEKGLKGALINAAVSGGKKSRIIMPFGTCPFHKNGLCSLQAAGKNELMPLVCRVYPRKRTTIGCRTETTLELSCIEAARLFSDHPACASELIRTDNMNDGDTDSDCLDKTALLIIHFRRKILDVLKNGQGSLVDREMKIYSYAAGVHSLLVRNKIDEALSVNVESGSDGNEKDAEFLKDRVTFYPMSFLNDCILNVIPYGHYFAGNRFFFDLLREYRITFGNAPYSRADEFMTEKYKKLIAENDDLKDIFSYYLQYLLIRTCPDAYSDCHVLKAVALPVLITDLLMVFFVCLLEPEGDRRDGRRHHGREDKRYDMREDKRDERREDKRDDPKYKSALAISSFEKAIIHSPALLKFLFRKIEKETINT